MSSKPTRPIVFVGPSGIGKNTIIKKLMELYPDRFAFSVSHTTRQPREGEVDGVNYNFITKEQFIEDREAGKFIETAEFSGNFYGTSFEAIQKVTSTGKICICDVNIDGAINLYKSNLHPFIILLRPTDLDSLERRLRGRGTESEESVKKRIATAKTELLRFQQHKEIFDFTVENDRLDQTLVKISSELFKYFPLP